jgi:hypothetical protein
MSEFAIEDAAIPDLVLETIFVHFAETTPMTAWGELCSVSRRWRRLARPVFRDAYQRAWPKFEVPRKPSLWAMLTFNHQRDLVHLAEPSKARWAFVRPLQLCDVVSAGQAVGVVFVPSCSFGVYVSAWLLHSRVSEIFDHETVWASAWESQERLPKGDKSVVVMGACSGAIF